MAAPVWLAILLVVGSLGAYLGPCASGLSAQSSSSQAQPAQPSPTQPAQDADIPDAPTVQPSAAEPEPPPIPKPEEKKPATVDRNPWTNQPNTPPANTPADTGAAPGDAASPPPPMPPVKTLPPGTSAKTSLAQDQLYTLVVHTNFVQLPVTVKDRDGRRVDGLLPTDFVVKENGVVQKLSYFTQDPFALSVAIVLDLGMSDATVQKVNQTFPALVGAFAPYDEVALYTFSSTVSEVSDFSAPTQKLTAIFNQIKTVRGGNNGPAVLSGPLAPNGPIINGIPVGSPTEPVYTPPKQSRVLNDAILQAALDLSKRERTRRKIIFVISDGREFGSQASYRDVLKLLLSREIQVKAVAVGSAALPVYDKVERLHLPKQGYDDILPKYVSATGGLPVYRELTLSAIADTYAQAMSDARNQYTLGYTPARPKTPTASSYRNIEVLVERPHLKIYAKDGYYPVPAAR
ncbi:MAG: VWA domain-containing protein [Candidatus Sulfotelmatobacter sp.]|jgi:VWFA-related protein